MPCCATASFANFAGVAQNVQPDGASSVRTLGKVGPNQPEVAEVVEQRLDKPLVAGSIPAPCTLSSQSQTQAEPT